MPHCICYKDDEGHGSRWTDIISLDSINADECNAVFTTNRNVNCGKHEPGSATEYHTAYDFCIRMPDEGPGASSSSGNSSIWPLPPSSVYYSTRIQSMINNRRRFNSDLEFEMDYSKVHHSGLDPTLENKYTGETNRKYFEELMIRQDAYRKQLLKIDPKASLFDKPGFFEEMDDLVLGEKIGEGAQAEIYEAGSQYVVKVFCDNFALQELQKRWPPGMLNEFHGRYKQALHLIQGATLLKNQRFLNRFSFVNAQPVGGSAKVD